MRRVGSGPCHELITRSQESYRVYVCVLVCVCISVCVCLIVCDLETPKVRQFRSVWPVAPQKKSKVNRTLFKCYNFNGALSMA